MKQLLLATALCLGLAACGDRDEAATANNAAATGEAAEAGDQAPGTQTATASFPKGARIVDENGVFFRIDPDGTRVRLEPTESRIVVEDNVRFRVDPDGTRVRIDERGIQVEDDDVNVRLGEDPAVEINTR